MIHTLKGSLAALAMGLNTLICATLLYLLAPFKFLVPSQGFRDRLRYALGRIAETWISINNWVLGRYRRLRWDISLPEELDQRGCYLINANHQSWVDILVLQRVFNRKAPFMRFFLKRQLIWVPFLGLAWWTLDFPFMRRYSREAIQRDPGLKGRDLEAARKACDKYRRIPVSIMNFLEGTRFSPAKRDRQKAPYQHLLKPRVGGLGQVIYSLNDSLRSLIDVTIVYPEGAPTFWQLISGQVRRIVVEAREVSIPDSFRHRNPGTDQEFRQELSRWAHALWQEKDQLIDQLLETATGAAPATR